MSAQTHCHTDVSILDQASGPSVFQPEASAEASISCWSPYKMQHPKMNFNNFIYMSWWRIGKHNDNAILYPWFFVHYWRLVLILVRPESCFVTCWWIQRTVTVQVNYLMNLRTISRFEVWVEWGLDQIENREQLIHQLIFLDRRFLGIFYCQISCFWFSSTLISNYQIFSLPVYFRFRSVYSDYFRLVFSWYFQVVSVYYFLLLQDYQFEYFQNSLNFLLGCLLLNTLELYALNPLQYFYFFG